MAESVYQFFNEEHNLETIHRLLESGVRLKKIESAMNNKFAEKTFVFTGALQLFTRDEAERSVESLGGRAASSVSRNTSFVVVGENAGSKAQKARDLGVPVLTEAEFKNMIE